MDSECGILWKFRSCGSLCGPESPQLLLDKGVDVPVVQVVQVVKIPVVAQRLFYGLADHRNSKFAGGGHGDRRPCCAGH